MAIYVLATLDTKGEEALFAKSILQSLGYQVVLVDVGILGEAKVAADISRDTFFESSRLTLSALQTKSDRGLAITVAAESAAQFAKHEYDSGRLEAILALGGSAGTTIGTSAMRALPLGVPKVMLSTMASGQVRQYVRDKDVAMLNSIVDIAGLNTISKIVIREACGAVHGLLAIREKTDSSSGKPLIAATMFGVTTPCVQVARAILEKAGYEVLVFHATGNGGEAMESLIRDGVIQGVLDITTTELADELVGGILSAGPNRLTAALDMGIPQVVSVGALDMVNFGPQETVPNRFSERKFYIHNPTVTLMRTTPEENRKLGEEIGRKLSRRPGPVEVLFPELGISGIDRDGGPFEDESARTQLLAGLREQLGQVPLTVLKHHINDEAFATEAANRLLKLLGERRSLAST